MYGFQKGTQLARGHHRQIVVQGCFQRDCCLRILRLTAAHYLLFSWGKIQNVIVLGEKKIPIKSLDKKENWKNCGKCKSYKSDITENSPIII